MSICDSGIESKISGGVFSINVPLNHSLILLANTIPWKRMYELVIADIKSSTAQGQWWRGRKLKVRSHLGTYILQQLYNLTDRQMEAAIKENIVYQLFCGKRTVKKWKAPDHTKIERFRSRLSPTTQQQLANLIAQQAVKIGIADSSKVDIDSTVQEANITYPTDAKMLRKLGSITAKVCKKINEVIPNKKKISVNLKNIASKAREYFFRNKNTTSKEKYALLSNLLEAVSKPVKRVISACKSLEDSTIQRFKWNIKRAIDQLLTHGESYCEAVQYFIATGKASRNKQLSFHASEVGSFSKDKPHKKYEFGRAFQLGRLGGNFFFVDKSISIQMHDKSSLLGMLEEHGQLFGENEIDSLATDKGYYSERNVKRAIKKGVNQIGIQVPCNTKLKGAKLSKKIGKQLTNRRSGIEPLIGHLKQGWQMGKSRMKNDKNTESSGYASVLGFNLRQMMKLLVEPYQRTNDAF